MDDKMLRDAKSADFLYEVGNVLAWQLRLCGFN